MNVLSPRSGSPISITINTAYHSTVQTEYGIEDWSEIVQKCKSLKFRMHPKGESDSKVAVQRYQVEFTSMICIYNHTINMKFDNLHKILL